ARVLANLGVERALVVHGMDGIDEISTLGETRISELSSGSVETYSVKPEDFKIKRAAKGELAGGDAAENAEIARNILRNEGERAHRDIVLLNAAAGIYVGGKADSILEGIEVASQSIDSGSASEKFEALIRESKSD
ncbi:MAG: anthranilate phosphoribosyltransferase, partial [Candidatus Hydrothermarchaeaceae archaeon]